MSVAGSTHICPCGLASDHVIKRASTADGKHVLLWADGTLTWALGFAVKGVGLPRTKAQLAAALCAGWLVMGDVSLYDADEVPALVAAARWAASRGGSPGAMRARLAAQQHEAALPVPQWSVLSADRDGKATCRVWRLPRLSSWSGYALWHERGRYDLVRRKGSHRNDDVTYEATGFSFPRLSDALRYLSENWQVRETP